MEIEEYIDGVRQRARRAIEIFARNNDETVFAFDRDSVAWLDGYIERMRRRAGDFNDGSWDGLIDTIGAFLGECIVARTGGMWVWSDGWGVRLPNGVIAFPMSKVAKQFKNGVEGGDSILGFYDFCADMRRWPDRAWRPASDRFYRPHTSGSARTARKRSATLA